MADITPFSSIMMKKYTHQFGTKEPLKVGEYFKLPHEPEDQPRFMWGKDIAGGVARIVDLPEGGNMLVEMESYVNCEYGQESMRFLITLEVLERLEKLGLPS